MLFQFVPTSLLNSVGGVGSVCLKVAWVACVQEFVDNVGEVFVGQNVGESCMGLWNFGLGGVDGMGP